MAAQGTTGEPQDTPRDDGDFVGDDAPVLGDAPEMFDDLELAHKVSSTPRGSGNFVEYVLFPLGVPRPTTGSTRTMVTCGRCGGQLWCTVYSRSAVDRARRRLRRIRVGTVSVLAAGWLGLLPALVLQVGATAMWISATVVFVVSFVAWAALDWLFFWHGQKMPAHIRHGYETHSLRVPGHTSEIIPQWNEPAI